MRRQFLLKWLALAVLGVGLTLGQGIAQTLLKEGVSKAIAPKLGGIVGALL